MNIVDESKRVWLGSAQVTSDLGIVQALVQRTDYGAHISLSDGQTASLWEYAVSGCVIQAAVSWAKRNGAAYVTVNGS